MYLFDTTFIIDLTNEDDGAIKKAEFIDYSPQLKALSVITVQEYLRGIQYLFSSDKKQLNSKIEEAEKELSQFEILQVDYNTAKVAAEIDANLLKKGTPVNIADVIIAATAIQYHLTVITRNTTDFEKIVDISVLKVENY